MVIFYRGQTPGNIRDFNSYLRGSDPDKNLERTVFSFQIFSSTGAWGKTFAIVRNFNLQKTGKELKRYLFR